MHIAQALGCRLGGTCKAAMWSGWSLHSQHSIRIWESAAQSNQNRQYLHNDFFFFLILSLHCSPLQIKTTNKNLTWAFESRLCSTGCCEEAGKTHLLLCFLQAHKGQPEELRRVTMATHKAGQRAQHRYSACPLWVGSCLLTRINAQTILIYTTYNYATVNAEYNVIIFPYITHYLLDSFSKADGESSGVNLIWAFNGYVISITG